MENTITKTLFSLFLLCVFPFQVDSVAAQEQGINHFFYTLTEESINELDENLRILEENGISTTLLLNPEASLNEAQVKTIAKLIEEIDLTVMLEDKQPLNQTFFSTKEYDKKIEVVGIYKKDKDKLIYQGETTLDFKMVTIPSTPTDSLKKIEKISEKENHAFLVNHQNFNLSTILLFKEAFDNQELGIDNYIYTIEKPDFIFRLFIYIGQISTVLFAIAVIIFFLAFILFRQWSISNFFE